MINLKAVLVSCILLCSLILNAQEVKLNIGDKAPLFRAKTDQAKDWKSKDYIKQKNLVVYFYPAAMTGGCTKQACAYRDDMAKFKGMNTEVVGVSGDDVENLKLFKEAHNLNFTLLSDPKGNIAKAFGVPMKDGEKTIEREIKGVKYVLKRGVTTGRWTFVFDTKGRLIYKSSEVNAAQDSKKVFEVLSEL